MKTKLIAAGAWVVVAVAGLGCQRTYEDRPAAHSEARELDSTARTETAQREYGERGQQEDVNLSQDMATGESEAFGGSGSAGMEEDFGYGGSGDGGMMMKGDAGMGGHHMDHHMMDAGTMMGADAGTAKKKATKK